MSATRSPADLVVVVREAIVTGRGEPWDGCSRDAFVALALLREQAERAEAERDEAIKEHGHYMRKAGKAVTRAESAEAERDEAKRERDEALAKNVVIADTDKARVEVVAARKKAWVEAVVTADEVWDDAVAAAKKAWDEATAPARKEWDRCHSGRSQEVRRGYSGRWQGVFLSAERYELSCIIGPCTESEATALSDAILGLPEARAVGAGGVGYSVFHEEAENALKAALAGQVEG